uniref:Uncharacterized protein n=1 Tax=Acrobeloides nanus TaxID=290746 RepID=A0A914CKY0_9BILA
MLTFADQMIMCNIGSANGPIVSKIGTYFNYVIEAEIIGQHFKDNFLLFHIVARYKQYNNKLTQFLEFEAI